MKKRRVEIESGIEGKVVFLKIYAHDDVTAGIYLAALNDWLESIAKAHPTKTTIIEGRRKDA